MFLCVFLTINFAGYNLFKILQKVQTFKVDVVSFLTSPASINLKIILLHWLRGRSLSLKKINIKYEELNT